jgi:hypothetical protein
LDRTATSISQEIDPDGENKVSKDGFPSGGHHVRYVPVAAHYADNPALYQMPLQSHSAMQQATLEPMEDTTHKFESESYWDTKDRGSGIGIRTDDGDHVNRILKEGPTSYSRYEDQRIVHERNRERDSYHPQTGAEHRGAGPFPSQEQKARIRIAGVDLNLGEASQAEASECRRPSSSFNGSYSAMQQANSESPRDTTNDGESASMLRAGTTSPGASTQDSEETTDQSPGTDECVASIQSIVRDLRHRVDQLLCKTEIQRTQFTMSPTRMPKLARRRSLPSISNSGQSRPTDDDRHTPYTAGIPESEEHVPIESPRSRRKEPPYEGPHVGLQPSLSQYRTKCGSLSIGSDRPVPRVRAKSEPPVHRAKLSLSSKATLGLRAHAYAEGRESNNGSVLQNNNASFQASSQKRKTRDGTDSEEREPDKRNEPNGKRRRLFSSELQGCKARFPCLLYAGEPDHYPNHTKRYEYIAQLL